MDAVAGSASSAFRPYLSDRLPTTGVSTSAPSPVTCIKINSDSSWTAHGRVEYGEASWDLWHRGRHGRPTF